MKYLIENISNQELLHQFIETDDSIYVFNLLARYFYYNLCIEMEQEYKMGEFNTQNFAEVISFFKQHSEELKLWRNDHTIRYALDVLSNTILFRHFLNYPWTQWENKTVLEVGAGFGIYVFLFNLIKEYYNVNIQLKSYDLSDYKLDKIRKIGEFLEWSDNKIITADCCVSETFDDCINDDIALIYSETFSREVGREPYFKIIDNIIFDCKDSIKQPYILFPSYFTIEGKNVNAVEYTHHKDDDDKISHVKINGIYQSLYGFEVDDNTQAITDYMREYYPEHGFRWWEIKNSNKD